MTHTATMKKAPPRHAHGALTPDKLRRFADRFEGKPAYRIAQNAVAQTSVEDVALNRAVITATDHTFSHLPDEWSATNQKKESGNGLLSRLDDQAATPLLRGIRGRFADSAWRSSSTPRLRRRTSALASAPSCSRAAPCTCA